MSCRLWAPALLLLALSAAPAGASLPEDRARRECERLNDSGSFADALPHCRQAAAAQRSASAADAARRVPGGDAGALGRALTSLGLALEMTGDRQAAEASYREALARHREQGLPELEALVLSNLAALSIGGGDYGAALAWLAEEEAVARRSLESGGAAWATAELDYVRINRSVALEQLGAYSEALAELRPLAGRTAEPGPGSAASGEAAALVVNLAVLYRNLGDPRRALALLDRARDVYEESGDLSALANVHLNRALVLQLNLRAPESAAAELAQALALAQSSGDRGEEIRTLCALGELRRQGGDLEGARQAFSQALAAAAASDAAAGRWAAEAGLGRVARDAGDADAALVHLRAAIAEIERAGAALGDSRLRGGLLSDQRAVYASAVDLLGERALGSVGPAAAEAALAALALAEQAKARELLDALAGGGSGEPLAPAEVSALLPRLGSTIAFFFGERHLWRWQSARGSWEIASAGNPAEIAALVSRVHLRLARAEPAEEADLARLGDRLLPRPLSADSELRIVPDGRLFYLPFELLSDPGGGGGKLIDHLAVSYLPSLAVFPHLRHPAESARWRLAALADPALPPPTSSAVVGSLAALLARRFGLPPLPGAVREVHDAARRLGEPSAVDIAAAASEATLRQRVSEGTRVLHIAAHTVVDESLAGGVALFLAPGAAGSGAGAEDDGLVTAEELARMPLAADLAVLSGCRTALPDIALGGGDGAGGGRALASLSGALLGAGARGVVASLWEVGDDATAALMQQFYFELARGERPASALRRAKLRLAQDARWAEAPGWAGFVLLGDPGPVTASRLPWWGLAALALLAGGALLLFGARHRRQAPQDT